MRDRERNRGRKQINTLVVGGGAKRKAVGEQRGSGEHLKMWFLLIQIEQLLLSRLSNKI